MAHWLIELKGSDRSLAFLSHFLNSSQLSVLRDEHGMYIRLMDLGDETTSASLFDISKRIVDTVNGAAFLLWPHFEFVTSNTVHSVADDGSRQTSIFVTASAPHMQYFGFLPNDTTLSHWVDLANTEPMVEKAFILYSLLPHDWKGLYMILEIIKDDVGSWNGLVTNGWISKARLRNFKHTADSFAAAGHSARHATTSITPPAKPMGLMDARTLTDEMLRKWLISKSDAQSK